MKVALRLIASVLIATLAATQACAADGPVWSALARGTNVILIRHAQTTPGVGDPPGFTLGDCATQRNLSDEGRTQARKLGQVFRARRIEIDRVLSSPWCRCIETARLAFDRTPQVHTALASFFDDPDKRDAQVAALRKLVGDYRGPGNLVLVTHGTSIAALTGTAVDMGTIVVVRPEGNGRFTLLGRADVP